MTTRYEDLPGVNWSTLKTMERSPLHYQHRLENSGADTDAFRLGRAAHRAILEPQLLEDTVVAWEGARRAGKEWEGFKIEHAGKDIISLAERDLVAGMAAAVHCHPAAQALLAGPCLVEHAHQWVDERTGIECKCRLDLVRISTSQMVEIKTARASDPRSFGRAAATYRYHGQVAFYHDGYGFSGDPMIIVVESAAPHDVVVYNAAGMLEPGRALYRHLLSRLAECRERNEWPGTSAVPIDIDLPDWAYEYTDGEDAMSWFREAS